MTLNINNIFIFKTNIQTQEDHVRVSTLLDNNDSIDSWSVDKEDIDCVLRIISDKITAKEIISKINLTGYHCTELE